MICSQCNQDKTESCFLKVGEKQNTICNSCIYKNKTESKADVPLEKRCLMCNEIVKGRRWKFCSEKCADEGNRINMKDNWRHKINAPTVDWRKLKL